MKPNFTEIYFECRVRLCKKCKNNKYAFIITCREDEPLNHCLDSLKDLGHTWANEYLNVRDNRALSEAANNRLWSFVGNLGLPRAKGNIFIFLCRLLFLTSYSGDYCPWPALGGYVPELNAFKKECQPFLKEADLLRAHLSPLKTRMTKIRQVVHLTCVSRYRSNELSGYTRTLKVVYCKANGA